MEPEYYDIKKEKKDYTQRVISAIPAPKWEYLQSEKLFTSNNGKKIPNVEVLKQHLKEEGRIHPSDALYIIKTASALFRKEPNLLQLKDPISVCGDVHGQYFDLLKLLTIGGDPKTTKYLFLGDYVDRGCFGTEVCFLLFCYKILYPTNFYMMRGNHECRHLTTYFNFKQECLFKYNQEIYDAFMNCFDCLPLSCLLNGRFLCVHGGLSPEITSIEQINTIDRFKEPPSSGPMCDLLWSDPMDEEEEDNLSSDNDNDFFVHNKMRGCSFSFSYSAADKFLKDNNLLSIIRAHEAQDDGYKLYKAGGSTKFPTVICIFSAPNYCDVYHNKGGIIRFQNNLMNIRQFNFSEHPYYLPNFMNAFNWSLPFVVDKLVDIFNVIINLCTIDEDEAEENNEHDLSKEKVNEIKEKVRSVARFTRMYNTLKNEKETVSTLKKMHGGKIPQGLLLEGPKAMQKAIKKFEYAKKIDIENEKRPPTKLMEEDTAESPSDKKELLQQMQQQPIIQPLAPLKITRAPKLNIIPGTPIEQ